MAQIIPNNFIVSSEGAIASYNYTDIASGTGFVSYYGAAVATDGGTSYILTTNPIHSSTATETNPTTIDGFSITFNKPQNIKGTLITDIPVIFSGLGNTLYCTITVYKNSTQIGTAISDTRTGAASYSYKSFAVPITISQTHFKKGDTLKIKLVFTKSGGSFYLGYDPQNRTTGETLSNECTIMRYYVPFVIDL